MELNAKSMKLLKDVHPALKRVVERCATMTQLTFIVTCGSRTLAEQKEMVAKGVSTTLKSRHIPGANGFSHAVDLAPIVGGVVPWKAKHVWRELADDMKAAAVVEKVKIEWGGDWRTFKDMPHFQLPWATYTGAK